MSACESARRAFDRASRRVTTLTAIALCAASALAHEMKPAYLELVQTGGESYDVTWKVPALGADMRLGLYVILPESCAVIGEGRSYRVGSAHIEKWSSTCAGGLEGGLIRIAGLESSTTDVVIRIEPLNGATHFQRLTAANPALLVAKVPAAFEVVRTYFALGVEHILLGIDHLLFVFALLLLIKGRGRLIGAITAFTVAHSITLACATMGIARLPGPPVEAVIALSIAFVAAEIVHRHRGTSGVTAERPWIAAFIFGLLHGFGFAGALSEIGLPNHAIAEALLSFNLGVEAGQLVFIALASLMLMAFASVGRHFKLARATATGAARQFLPLIAPYAIGALAMSWFIERAVACIV